MRKIGIAIFLVIISFSNILAQSEGVQDVGGLESAKVGKFPSNFRTWPFRRGKTAEIYHVEEENGKRFIRAKDDKDYSLQAMRDFNWPVVQYPYFTWRWRAKELPVGAREDDDKKNDSACGVYVVFGKTSGHAMKYVWSSELPIGKVVSRRNDKLKIKVLQSGKANLNQWQTQTVNVVDDYKELFGDKLNKNPSGFAILTDGNATHSSAACDYGEFSISNQSIK